MASQGPQKQKQQVCSADDCTAVRSDCNPFVRIPGVHPSERFNVERKKEHLKATAIETFHKKDECRRRQLEALYLDSNKKQAEIDNALKSGKKIEVCQGHYDPSDICTDKRGAHLRFTAIPKALGYEKEARNKKRQRQVTNLEGDSPRTKRRQLLRDVRAGRDHELEREKQLEACELRVAELMEDNCTLEEKLAASDREKIIMAMKIKALEAHNKDQLRMLHTYETQSIRKISMEWVLTGDDERVQHFTGFQSKEALQVCRSSE